MSRHAIGEPQKVTCPICDGPAYEQGLGYHDHATLWSGQCLGRCGGWVNTMSRAEEAAWRLFFLPLPQASAS